MDSPAIGLITPSHEILSMASAIAEQQGVNLILAATSLHNAVLAAQEIVEKDNVEVIIAFRGTAKILRNELSIPVLAMPDNTTRKLIAIGEASKISNKILLTLYHQEHIENIEFFENLFNVKLHCEYYSCAYDIERNIKKGIEANCGVVVGGGTSRRIGQKYGLPGIIVLPSELDFSIVFENSINIIHSKREEHKSLLKHQAVLNAVSDGIIAVDSDGTISMINTNAKNIFSLPDASIGKKLETIVHDMSLMHAIKNNVPILNEIKSVGKETFVLNSIPIQSEKSTIGGVCTVMPAEIAMRTGKIAHKAITSGYTAKYSLDDYVHAGQTMQTIMSKIRRYATCDSTVLLTGETGTGKEILAHGLHRASRRCHRSFVSINCSAISESLLESELFGYEGGTFTGGRREGKIGLLELADEGTLFLDEINSMSLTIQTHLLRFLQEKEVRRVGGRGLVPVNVRIIAATNQPLIDEVRAGRMRKDLFYRLNVLPVEIPPLRKRPEDIPDLINKFMSSACMRNNFPIFTLPQDCILKMCDLPWHGNARELKHVIERLVLLSDGLFIQSIFDEVYSEVERTDHEQTADGSDVFTFQNQKRKNKLTHERIESALRQTNCNKAHAALLLGVSRSTLWRAMTQKGIAVRIRDIVST